ncbi:MAG: transposase [Burkholderiaceae bacterium]
MQRALLGYLREQAGVGRGEGQGGAVTVIQRFGSAANLNNKVVTLRGAQPREAATRQRLCADIDGFSLHGAVRCEAHERQRLEHLCRHLTRPALSDERLKLAAGAAAEGGDE